MLMTNLAKQILVSCEEVIEAIDEAFRMITECLEVDGNTEMDIEEIIHDDPVDVVSLLELSDKCFKKADDKPYQLKDSVDVFVDFRSHKKELEDLRSFRFNEHGTEVFTVVCSRFKTETPKVSFDCDTLMEWYYAYFYTNLTVATACTEEDNPINMGRESSKQLQILIAEMLCRALLTSVDGKVTPSMQYVLFFIFKSDYVCLYIMNMLCNGLENLRSMTLSHAFMKSTAAHNHSVCVSAQTRDGL